MVMRVESLLIGVNLGRLRLSSMVPPNAVTRLLSRQTPRVHTEVLTLSMICFVMYVLQRLRTTPHVSTGDSL